MTDEEQELALFEMLHWIDSWELDDLFIEEFAEPQLCPEAQPHPRSRAAKVEQIDKHERRSGVRRWLKRRRARLLRRGRSEAGFRGYSG